MADTHETRCGKGFWISPAGPNMSQTFLLIPVRGHMSKN
jgi:hypothetical protein